MTATAEKLDIPDTAEIPGVTRPMTYEEYVRSPEERARYDILEGYKVYRRYGKEEMAAPTRQHQRLVRRIARLLEDFAAVGNLGECFVAPCDVLIRHIPLKARQPDVLLISRERLDQNPPDDSATPLDPAPELVVEIISPSERPGQRTAKLADYRSVDVKEVWQVFAEAKTIEVVALTEDAIEVVGTYKSGASVVSVTFPDLTVAVDALFAE
ncbi:Uma2 family endonuclease [Armatimonas sp.]|uniref:Uma2 family endonuclease n=1 Tax=Armatimonas sp. TaxID=1872638 RepID=UPI00286B6D5A|nr:Uma2 family endonuclease [Armatimonas sp.]